MEIQIEVDNLKLSKEHSQIDSITFFYWPFNLYFKQNDISDSIQYKINVVVFPKVSKWKTVSYYTFIDAKNGIDWFDIFENVKAGILLENYQGIGDNHCTHENHGIQN